ncbi:MAG: hypothetical protein WAW69_03040, partial [Polaromonas sp.]
VLADPQRQAAMRHAQRTFHDSADLGRIARFALDPALPAPGMTPDFGAEHGSAVTDIDAALARLQAEVPCDIELLLSYSTAKTPQRVVLENPFGHIAIRVDDTVYSANYVAVPGQDPNLLQHVTLADYLYGVQPPSPSQVHTNTYGMAKGITVVVNGSREYLETAAQRYPELVPVWVEVSPEVLRARLQARGREGAEEIEKRLARAPKNQFLGRRGELIRNDGELHVAGDTLVNLIRHCSDSPPVLQCDQQKMGDSEAVSCA